MFKNISRKNRTSHTNGIVGVIKKVDGDYSWLKKTIINEDGCSSTTYDESKLYSIIIIDSIKIPKDILVKNVKQLIL